MRRRVLDGESFAVSRPGSSSGRGSAITNPYNQPGPTKEEDSSDPRRRRREIVKTDDGRPLI